ncbi:hypothetical protein MANES_09G003300v8 [Manihot esculenta]|uniref:Uncharacterized protein n=1 Tax=Manihot esculenta TaxID=3983 RepID=A0A2C9V6F9_MANES|nr:hypothetical protein MANES_09G003300v8 [Manihot esculenta]
MNWVTRKKKQMGFRRKLACLYLLLLIMSQLETPCSAVGYGKFSRFKGRSASASASDHHHHHLSLENSNGVFKGKNSNKDPDEIFGAEKRKIYTGPNPLHNR